MERQAIYLTKFLWPLLKAFTKATLLRLTHGPQSIICLTSDMTGFGGTELQYRILIEKLHEQGLTSIAITSGTVESGTENPELGNSAARPNPQPS